LLSGVDRTEFTTSDAKTGRVDRLLTDNFRWPTSVTAEMVAAAVCAAVGEVVRRLKQLVYK
jgi:lipopolysaccharide export system permease protein